MNLYRIIKLITFKILLYLIKICAQVISLFYRISTIYRYIKRKIKTTWVPMRLTIKYLPIEII